jgi:hypothetical protein
VIVPSVDKVYTIRNSTTGGFSVVVKTAAGSGVTVANGLTQSMYCDATNVVASGVAFNNATNTIASNVTGNVTGNVSFGAGSAGSPGISVTGDSDTGIFSPGANVLSIGVGGDRLMDFSQSTSILQNKLGDAEANYWVRLADASAVNVRSCQYGALNENSIPLASFRPVLATDGSSNIEFYATPAGSRASDRRVLRMNVPGSGQITMNGGLGLNAGTAAAPAYSFSSDTNTGIFSPGADQLALSAGGAEVLRATATGVQSFQTLTLNNGGANSVVVSANDGGIELIRGDGAPFIDFKSGIGEDYDCRIQQVSNGLDFSTGGDGSSVARLRVASDGSRSSVIPGGSTLLPEFQCRAWVNFNGTGTVAIRASGNVSSITDNGTGDYTVNFTTNMPDANYCASIVAGSQTVGANGLVPCSWRDGRTVSQLRFGVSDNNTDSLSDAPNIDVAIFR